MPPSVEIELTNLTKNPACESPDFDISQFTSKAPLDVFNHFTDIAAAPF